VPSESLKVPEVNATATVADPAEPAELVLKGPCTPPLIPLDPPPPVNENIAPVVEPEILDVPPPLAVTLNFTSSSYQ
jgi:hypothetical protein